ncbi:MAG: hypothetical protein ACQEVA_22355 [Myxococcota bacterium]
MELFGYGLEVSLKHPSQLARLAPEQAPKPDTAVLARPGVDGVGNVLLAPGEESKSGEFEHMKFEEEGQAAWGYRQEEGGTEVVLGNDMETIDTAATLSAGDGRREWRLRGDFEGTTYTTSWPKSYNVVTTGEDRPRPFELFGHDRSRMYVQGPIDSDQAAPLDAFVREGFSVVEQDDSKPKATLVLEHEHDGEKWRQYHQKFDVGGGKTVVVSMQCPAETFDHAKAAAETLADSVELAG